MEDQSFFSSSSRALNTLSLRSLIGREDLSSISAHKIADTEVKYLQPELNSQLEETDRAYLAGLFDGEGCANATFRSRGVTSKKEKKKVRYFWPTVQFVISGIHSHLQPIQEFVGVGGLYQQKTGVWDFRMTQPKQVLIMTNTLLPYVRLKKRELLTLRKAALFMIRHERRSRWTKAELDEFHKRFVIPLKKRGETWATT